MKRRSRWLAQRSPQKRTKWGHHFFGSLQMLSAFSSQVSSRNGSFPKRLREILVPYGSPPNIFSRSLAASNAEPMFADFIPAYALTNIDGSKSRSPRSSKSPDL